MKKLKLDKLNAVVNGVLIGIVVGIITSCFRLLIDRLFLLIRIVYRLAASNLAWVAVIGLTNIVIGILIAWIINDDPDIKGSGIPQSQGQITGVLKYPWFKTLWHKFIGSILTVGSGIFMGPEGPAIQIGASAAQGISILRTDDPEKRRTMMAGGVASGLATIFNAPIASTLFVLEGVYRDFSILVSLTALTSAIIANFISTVLFGEIPIFHLADLHMYPLHDYGLLIILGVVIGIAGYFYQQITLKVNSIQFHIKGLPSNFNVLIPLILVIPFGMDLPIILGSGSNLIIKITRFKFSIGAILLYLILRFLLSELSMSTKAPGGILVPMLVIGALIGDLCGQLFIDLGLLNPIYLSNIIIIGMVGFFASISQTPFTSIILITEMVGTLQHLMALAFVTVIAYLIADILGNGPLYDIMLKQITDCHFKSIYKK
ncbi:ATP synthase F0 subunit A [Philodulcilactobacillus myokoensis]|uniref:ATP synthase F0 subunit A n=1 Tax=Philodulcilactobacillus myokoensis TaxID=2929573 RepID=A0A9W6B1F0_9LACO|nr:ClC family H(+)/Cl(-) exchange transporter [Philodulcilactobacillus myokoensis]GLB47125.1 ATP synthase F0 subunit A [Philodulcilactobacillus myokoensis]